MQDWDGDVGLGGPGCNAGDLAASGDCKKPAVIKTGFGQMLNRLFTRIDTGSGPYQMVAVLSDGIVFRCDGGGDGDGDGDGNGNGNGNGNVRAEYIEEAPVEYFNQRYDALPRLVWHFGYAQQRQGLHQSQETGTLFQVHLWWYPGDCSASAPNSAPKKDHSREPRAKEVLKLGESIHTRWGLHDRRQRVGKWLHEKLASVTPGSLDKQRTPDRWTHPSLRSRRAESADDEATGMPTSHLSEGGGGGDGNTAASAPSGSLVAPNVDITMAWHNLPSRSSEWTGGLVDLNLMNVGDDALVLQEYQPPGCSKGIASADSVRIAPGKSARISSYERHCWVARKDDSISLYRKDAQQQNVVGQWTVDRADGLVQDILLPFDHE